jgi:hypothetical protein
MNAATVAGGTNNLASGWLAVVGGGEGNTASGVGAVVAGGWNNAASNYMATVAGGDWNGAMNTNSTVGGGYLNTASGDGAVVAGGGDNTASGDLAVVGAGGNNKASGFASFVGGGGGQAGNQSLGNIASGEASVVGGGYLNIAGGLNATVGGGWGNIASGNYAMVLGGDNNHANGNYSFAGGSYAWATNSAAFVWSDGSIFPTSSTADQQFMVRASGGFVFYTSTNNNGVSLAAGSGSWTTMSDRNAKENFAPVDAQSVLAKVAALPLATWNYKSQNASIRHLGPMAQDFKAGFAVGETDTGISTVDADGVALAAIQGLNQKVEAQLKAKDAEIQDLKARLEKLEKLMLEKTGGVK